MIDKHAGPEDTAAARVALWRALHLEVDAPPHVFEYGGRAMARVRALVPGWLAAAAVGAGVACSDGGSTGDSTASSKPLSPQAASGGSASGTERPGMEMPPAPAASGAPAEGNPTPAGPVAGNAPAPGSGAPPPAAPADAGVAATPPVAIAPACSREETDANKATVAAGIDELFVQGDITAVDRYWAEPYLQHNPDATSGVTTFRNLFGGLISPNNSIYDLSRVVGQCDLVLIHGNYTSFGGPTFDMFRVAAGRIVEHWDAFAVGAGPNPSGHTALDGPSVVEGVALTAQNEALVLDFVQTVLIGGAVERLGDYMSPDLIEHDPESRDGLAAYAQNRVQRGITYSEVHHDIADGNFVFVLSEGAVDTTVVAHYDLFRVDGARIVEHWNGRRDVPPTTQSGLGIF